jgi:predicted Zn finger-like uncharacterized protein
MLTVCPKCALTLAVTAGDLRLGQGYVRCGRCSDVFNALLTLGEETMPTGKYEPVPDTEPPALQSAGPELMAKPVPEAAMEPDAAPAAEVPPAPTPPAEPEPVAAAAGAAAAMGVELTELEFTPAATAVKPTAAGEPAAADRLAAASQPAAAVLNPVVDEPVDADESVATGITGVQLEPPLPRVNRRLHYTQVAGIALAVLLLSGQCVHHWRNGIASHPDWYPMMDRTYSALGVPLTPDWSLDDYDLRQLGTASYGDNQTLWIRLRLANRVKHALPWPQLRVSLSDRYGKHLASRVLQPRDYLLPAHAGANLMQPAQRIETEVGVSSPAASTSSFELDVCLPAAGSVRCAGDNVLGPPARS